MATSLDPLAAAARIEEDYISYLTTSFAPLDADLQHDFVTALREPQRVRKGPYLQATPPYRPGASIAELVGERLLDEALLDDGAALPPQRPLYLHQEQALRSCLSGANMIVATGTGSGKTECYLLPILNHLLRERAAGTHLQPGVRALLLYPMNALANDQMKRIRELFAPYPDLTFGRYIGDTERSPDRALAAFRRQMRSEPPPGELIDRETMQLRPPHVLLTNFAMLEYLLLRPQDSSLFDGSTGRHWRFIVLDEVHVYDGAKGAEVAMLLRRVRDRVHSSTRGQLRCIGTSATLGGGVKDSEIVAGYASSLFDEPFEGTGIIHPTRMPLAQSDAQWTIDESHLAALHRAWLDGRPALELAQLSGRLDPVGALAPDALLWQLLHDESHVIALQNRLESGSSTVEALHDLSIGWTDPGRALVRLVDLCIAARRDAVSAPLLPARYHLWLRASEGSFVCLHPRHRDDQSRVRLDRFDHCPSCTTVGVDATMHELSVCRHCRRHLLIGRIQDNRFVLASSFDRDIVCLLPGERVPTDRDADEDEEAIEGEVESSVSRLALCLGCRQLADRPEPCGCARPEWISVVQLNAPGSALKRCPFCKRQSNSGVALRFLSGSEAPVSVLATSLYQSIPPAAGSSPQAVADGRKLLMFSDSRQDAAFFAPYLRRTYSRALERRLVWECLGELGEAATTEELVIPLRRLAERLGVLEPDGNGNSAESMTWLFAEILATDRRQSLDGVGLAEIAPRLPASAEPPDCLMRLGLSGDEAMDVVRILLETVRNSAAVTVPDKLNVREDQRFAPRNTTTRLRGAGATSGVISWSPTRGSNRRLDYLGRLLTKCDIQVEPDAILRQLWDELSDPAGPYRRVLVSQDVRSQGTVFALDHSRIEFIPRHVGSGAYRCGSCRQIAWRNVRGVCPAYRCNGSLEPIRQSEPNHYLSLYERLAPISLTVEEHTGQLRSNRAAELQEKFTRGELNALSCSTTFELGVDVGEVQAILMRNIPPSPANYVQRAGRAGRRLGSSALVVAFAQRRSHDRSYYDDPRSMIDGLIAAPFIATDNEAIIRRHVHAVAFSMFERERVDRGNAPVVSMGDFIADGGNGSVADQFADWLRRHPASLQSSLRRILPSGNDALGIEDWTWVDTLFTPDASGVGGWLTALVDGLRRDLSELENLEAEASSARKHNVAQVMQKSQLTLRGRRVLDRFAQGGVLPKYGFPVDVVELDLSMTQSGTDLELSRDLRLGILEFAPGAKVVAANKLWRSVGIRLMPGRELPLSHWGICNGCGCLRTRFAGGVGDEGGPAPCGYCGSDQYAPGRAGKFISPIFGFVGDLDDENPGETRPPREGHLETHFAEFDGPPPDRETIDLGGTRFGARVSRRGWVTVFNRGRTTRGFWYCSWCGHAQDAPPKVSRRTSDGSGHTKPRSTRECKGKLSQVDLGHRFITNVVELDLPLADGAWSSDVAALSTMHALISAAPAIGVAQADIGGSLSVGEHGKRTVVLFDDVPGGAGHSRYLRENIGDLVFAAQVRMGQCTCGADTSCYGCLRSYRNQQDHDLLVRQAAIDILSRILPPQ